jgi:hypothetical protein
MRLVEPVWAGRAVDVGARYGENAPMAVACCNACRTCATSNILALVTVAAGVVGG